MQLKKLCIRVLTDLESQRERESGAEEVTRVKAGILLSVSEE